MRRVDEVSANGFVRPRWSKPLATRFSCAVLLAACSNTPSGDPCGADQNGVQGGQQSIELTVSDTAFTVGAADSGPGEPNITVENSAIVTLTMSNVGTRPHDFVVQCMATPNASGCSPQSCFPPEAGIPALQPGTSRTTVFVAPIREGTYGFVSDLPGDTLSTGDGGVTGLVGQFVLL
ncbi:MAG: hypothetical protein M3O50_22685 [Myxococcota bacterium]|nr:hypothetical protein [Myxococcota bacterium]